MKEKIDKLGKCVKQLVIVFLALHRSKIAGIGVKDIPLRKMEIFK